MKMNEVVRVAHYHALASKEVDCVVMMINTSINYGVYYVQKNKYKRDMP